MTELGFSIDNLTAKDTLFIKRLQAAVSGIMGYTLYRVEGLDEEGRPSDESIVSIVKKGGIAEHMRSRVEQKGPLIGTKRTIVRTSDIYAGSGKSDNASIVIIPLLGSTWTIENLLLFHVDFNADLPSAQKKNVLGEKYGDIKNLMDEENLPWSDEYLKDLPVKFLLGEAVEVIVDEIKKRI
jgi:glucosamine--fructose-6-phosphate aminotransferase (isomerizing)